MRTVEWIVLPGFSFPIGGGAGGSGGDVSLWGYTGLGEGYCSQCAVTSPTALMQSVLASVVQGCFSLTPMF